MAEEIVLAYLIRALEEMYLDYRNIFIQKAKRLFRDNVIESQALDEAERIITSYFIELEESLENEIDVSGGEFKIGIYPNQSIEVFLDEKELIFGLEGNELEISLRFVSDMNGKETQELDRLFLNKSDKKFYSRKSHQELNNNLLDDYLRQAFDDVLDALIEEKLT